MTGNVDAATLINKLMRRGKILISWKMMMMMIMMITAKTQCIIQSMTTSTCCLPFIPWKSKINRVGERDVSQSKYGDKAYGGLH